MNKKILLVAAILGITVLTFSVAAPALAAGGPGNGGGKGGYGGYGNQGTIGTGVPLELSTTVQGVLGYLIHINLADSLGISVDEMTLRLDAGETFSSIAISLGFDVTAINSLLVDARADAVARAIADGLITQETADWLASHGNDNPAAGYGDGICDGTGTCLYDGTYQNTMAQKGYRKGAIK